MALTTTSAAISGMTTNGGVALPATFNTLIAVNNSASDMAICVKGGTCTCPANGIATTMGLTVKAGGGSWPFNLPAIANTMPTAVMCSGTGTMEFRW